MLALVALLFTASAALPGDGGTSPPEALLRAVISETAMRNVNRFDADWEPAQRDCAGLVRHAFRSAYRTLAPARVEAGLWLDAQGGRGSFADAETLLAHNFVRLGRAPELLESLRSGDLVAFRQAQASGETQYHLMLLVRPPDRAHGPLRVIYHPGAPGEAVRQGTLLSLNREGPLEWRTVPENQAFLGYFRFKEWMR